MNEKELIKRIGICVLLVLLCAFAVHFIIGTRKDVHNNGYGTNAARDELTNAQTTQREEARTITETEKAITRSQKGIDDSEQANREIADTERKDTEIIDECQSILARVRERATSKD